MIDALSNLTTNVELVLRSAAAVIAIAFVLLTFIKTRASFVPVVSSILVSGLMIWAVTMNGAGWFGSRINEDANKLAAPAVMVMV